MIYKCPTCQRPIAKEDRRKKEMNLTIMPGVKAMVRQGECPKFRCPCGKYIFLLKGSLL